MQELGKARSVERASSFPVLSRPPLSPNLHVFIHRYEDFENVLSIYCLRVIMFQWILVWSGFHSHHSSKLFSWQWPYYYQTHHLSTHLILLTTYLHSSGFVKFLSLDYHGTLMGVFYMKIFLKLYSSSLFLEAFFLCYIATRRMAPVMTIRELSSLLFSGLKFLTLCRTAPLFHS